ncbi:hypothetical protein M9H77_30113 [Catharanthus roseus]|uniref:Uncharacterized protein n=1 Tax=Catharanthus roseus TaxID=4058 RepID=A0ACB9ZX80_CATRO|nr:hypothetical protein M9H77_30113 [Catharanthus roseus]
MNIQEKFQTIPLLSKVSLSKYFEKGFRYIHYGLIQVAVKPLVHIGVDAPVYLALRDKRLKRYKPSLLAMIQTNICNGPIYFNCAPNYSVSLTDPLIINSLVLDIHMQGDEFEKLTEQFVVMYRVYYRLLSSQLNPRFKMIPTSRDETVLLHIEAEQSKTFTPKRLKWHEITIPEEFQIENPHPPRDIERNEISQIIEEPDGNVLIRFNSMREQGSSSKFSIPLEPSRHSFVEPSRCSFAEKSDNSFSMPNPIHVHHKAPIPEVSISPPLSPTASQMKGEIDVIHKNLEIDLDSLENDILDPENEEKRKWYFQLDPVYQNKIRQEWINDINRLNIPFDFFCCRHSFVEPSRCSFAEKSDNSFSMPNPIHVHHKAPIPEVSISPPLSPTASQMKEIDLDSLENDILDPENEEKRKWYFQLDPVYQNKIRQEWINDIIG